MKKIDVKTNSRMFFEAFLAKNLYSMKQITGVYRDDADNQMVHAEICIWTEFAGTFPDFVFIYDKDNKYIKVNDELQDFDKVQDKWNKGYLGCVSPMSYFYTLYIAEKYVDKLKTNTI